MLSTPQPRRQAMKGQDVNIFEALTRCLTVFQLVMVREHTKHDRVDFAKTERR